VTAIIIALLTAFGGLVVWFFKLILIERYQFMDKIGDEPVKIRSIADFFWCMMTAAAATCGRRTGREVGQ
jgi:hypothetical protein